MYSPLEQSFKIIALPPYERLAYPVSCHPDMLMFVKDKKIVIHDNYYEANSEIFAPFFYNITLSNEKMGSKYPDDILFNALALGDTLFCKSQSVSSHILKMFKKTADVAQGYAACSTLALSDSAIITADSSIARAARDNLIDVLQITQGNIKLPGYLYGFIGGASFVYKKTVYFFGNIDTHPDSELIKAFIHNRDMDFICLDPRLPLCDFGSGKIFDF